MKIRQVGSQLFLADGRTCYQSLFKVLRKRLKRARR